MNLVAHMTRFPDQTPARTALAPALAVRGVGKSFGPVRVLSSIDISVAEGEFVSLLGPSGCGKTTLLRIVAGLDRQDTGEVAIRGRSVDGLGAAARQLGMVFQNYALFPNMTVAENIAFPLRFRGGIDWAEVARLISVVRLDGFEARYPHQLSGGQQQRVAFARALAGNPQLLLLDEPLSALDAKVRAELRVELKRLQRETGLTLLYVTHDQEEALALSDRIAVMNRGRIEQMADPRTLYLRPATPFVAGFIGRSNVIEGEFRTDGVRLAAGGQLPPLGRWRGRGMLAIRPEMLRPDPAGPIAAEVITTAFLGSAVEAELSVELGQRRAQWGLRLPIETDLAPGSRLRLAIDPNAPFIPL